MDDKCWKITWLGQMVVVSIIGFSVSAHAGTVLKEFYDGALGDADPVTQGWTKTLFDLNGVSSLTPDPDNDRVHMIASGLGTVNYARKQLLTDEPEIIDAISDDIYAWEVEVQVKHPDDADADQEARHGISDMNFITGTNSGSVGFRDRFVFETTDRPIGSPVERIRMTGSWFPSAGFSGTIRPHTAANPQPWTNFTSVYNRNVYRFERNGLGLDTVKLFINGDLVFRGAGGVNAQGSTEVALFQSCTRVGVPECVINQYWYRFSLEVDELIGTPDEITMGTQWVRSHPIHIAGTVDATAMTGDDVTTYADVWNASGADVFPTGADHITNSFDPNGLPWTLWISPGGEGPDGVFQQSEVGVPANLPGRIGYHIGGEPKTQAETEEVIATAAALKAYDPNGLVYVGLNTNPTNAMVNQMLSDPNLDAFVGHRYDSDNATYADLQRYRAFGLAHNKPYFRFVRSFKIRPTEFREPYDLDNSDLRFKTFSALTYGYTGIIWFFYNLQERHQLDPQQFTTTETYDLALRKTPQFEFTAGLNKELVNVGNMITQLRSTDVRLHLGDNAPYSQPATTIDWSFGAGGDPYITGIDQLTNDNMDILIGYFSDYHGESALMVMNTLHAHCDNPSSSAGNVRVQFDFSSVTDPTFDKTRIRRLSRTSGFWEPVTLISDSGDQYHADVVVPAGTGELFKYVLLNPLVADFDFDDELNAADIDLMRQGIQDNSTHAKHDINYDGVVDDGDFIYQIETLIGSAFGDADLNMQVNFTDFVSLTNNFGSSGTGWAQGNFNLDDITNFEDFVLLTNNYGVDLSSGVSAETTVPEPASLVLLSLAVGFVARRRRGIKFPISD